MKTRHIALTTAAAAAALALILTAGACSSGSSSSVTSPTPTPGAGGGGSTAPTFQQVQTQILTPTCTGCHTSNGRTPAAGMDLTAAVSYGNLVNVASSGKPGAIRVIPGDPDNSYLIHKLEGASDIVGLRMPRNGPPYLTDAQVAMVRQWIAAGALNN